jgi:hypothetical protein
MRVHDLPADRESQSEAIGLRGEECIEDPFEAIRGYAVAVVGNDHVQRSAFRTCVQLDAPIGRLAILHRIARVE